MTEVRFTIELEGAPILDRRLSRVVGVLSDWRQIWPGIIVELQAISKKQFTGQGVGPSGQWKPLTEAYRKWKEKRFPGQPILVRTGATRDALISRTQHSIIDPQPTQLTFGVSLPYPIYHQRGGKRLPRRPLFDFEEQDKVRLVKVVQRRILKAGRDNGVTIS